MRIFAGKRVVNVMKTTGYLFFVFLAVCILVVWSNKSPALGSSKSATLDVGRNRIGEACRVVTSLADHGAAGAQAVQNVVCGNWEKPSAKVFVAKKDRTAMELATRGWWRERLDGFAVCGQPSPTNILDGVQALAVDCRLRPGGWPYQALAVDIGDKLYLVESIPAAYPVAERVIGIHSGKLARSQRVEGSGVSAEMKRLESTLAHANYSAGDLETYRNLLRIAQYHNFMGNHADAEKRYMETLEVEQKVLPGGTGDQCFLYMHIALELSNQEKFNLADATFERAQALLLKSMEPAVDEARLTGYLAMHMANLRKNNKALALARKATEMRRELARQFGYSDTGVGDSKKFSGFQEQEQLSTVRGLTPNAAAAVGDLVQSLFLEAAMSMELKQLDDADRLAGQALKIMEQEPRVPRRWAPLIQLLQATVAEWKADWPRAERLLLKSIDTQRSLFCDSRTEGLALLALGRVYAAQGRSGAAFDSFRKGFEVINKTRFSISMDDAIPYWRLCLEEAKRNPDQRERLYFEMFEVAQMVRGITVAQTMAQTMARLASGKDKTGQLIRDLQDAQYARDKVRETLTLAQADPKTLSGQLTELERNWAVLNSRIEELERQVQSAAPSYNQIQDRRVPARDVLAVLRPSEALVQVLVGSSNSFVFFTDSEGTTPYEINLTEPQARVLVSKMRNAVEAGDQLRLFPVGDAHNLYQVLFGPVKERLAKVKHLITVPSDPLLSLPFGVLATEPPGYFTRSYYSEVAWMALKHGITLAPSVQSFVNLRSTARPSKAAHSFIGFGDFAPHGDDANAVLKSMNMPETCRQDAVFFAEATKEKLPNSGVELRQVASALGAPESSLVMGNSFSAAAVQKANLENYSIVYFSTHGLLPSKLKCFREPALVVSKPPGDSDRTGLLTTSEIAGLKMDAELVVLSACDTGGSSEKTGGESLTGLARSFFYAGTRSLLVTHWEMLDKPATELLITCFRSLATQDISLAEALRNGQTALIENPSTSHPMIWGVFSLVGDGGQHIKGAKPASH